MTKENWRNKPFVPQEPAETQSAGEWFAEDEQDFIDALLAEQAKEFVKGLPEAYTKFCKEPHREPCEGCAHDIGYNSCRTQTLDNWKARGLI